jgi:hypothetical protein
MDNKIEKSLYLQIENLIKNIKDNVLLFILTKQYNFDYGMPETYNPPQNLKYMFKAIPYAAVDNPVIGSEFSDPILTYILTFFCYKIRDGMFRKIDKNYIVSDYESLYMNKKNPLILSKLFSFFTEKPLSSPKKKKNG